MEDHRLLQEVQVIHQVEVVRLQDLVLHPDLHLQAEAQVVVREVQGVHLQVVEDAKI